MKKGFQLLVFCHSALAYAVPEKIIKLAKKHDKNYHEGIEMEAAWAFFKDIEKRYEPIVCGHLMTGDIG